MDVLLGLLLLVFIIGNGLALARRERRSGKVHDYGHPIKDNLLLLASAIILASAMFAVIWWAGAPHLRSAAGQFLLRILLAVAVGITYLANHFLRRGAQKRTGR
jgi:hypothetical protein